MAGMWGREKTSWEAAGSFPIVEGVEGGSFPVSQEVWVLEVKLLIWVEGDACQSLSS